MFDYEELGQSCGAMWTHSDRYKTFIAELSKRIEHDLDHYIASTCDTIFVTRLANYTKDEIEDFKHNFYLEVMEDAVHQIRKGMEGIV